MRFISLNIATSKIRLLGLSIPDAVDAVQAAVSTACVACLSVGLYIERVHNFSLHSSPGPVEVPVILGSFL